MLRLNEVNLERIADSFIKPNYSRRKLTPGILHLGIGAFHRAHQAYYTDALFRQNDDNNGWGIISASFRSAVVRDQMLAQDFLYTHCVRQGNEESYHIIGSVMNVLVARENPEALIQQIACENIRLVTLTITEKGYHHDPASKELNANDPDIRHDVNNIESPRTAVGFIVCGLMYRRAKNLGGLTFLSCDNLPGNGRILKSVVLQMAHMIDDSLVSWIEENIAFPSSMVDRIVPATTDDDREAFSKNLGIDDQGLVISESFSQWVIEDNFACGRPEWEKVGVKFVNDISAYEDLKLRVLNACHSVIAYLGHLCGCEYVYQAMEMEGFKNMLIKLLDEEIAPSINIPDGFDISNYKNVSLQRFSNSAIKHKTLQIAADGSQKIPQRWLSSLREQIRNGGPTRLLSLALAGWIRFLQGEDEQGQDYDIIDPLCQKLHEICTEEQSSHSCVEKILSVREIFDGDLIQNSEFINEVAAWLDLIKNNGAKQAICKAVE